MRNAMILIVTFVILGAFAFIHWPPIIAAWGGKVPDYTPPEDVANVISGLACGAFATLLGVKTPKLLEWFASGRRPTGWSWRSPDISTIVVVGFASFYNLTGGAAFITFLTHKDQIETRTSTLGLSWLGVAIAALAAIMSAYQPKP